METTNGTLTAEQTTALRDLGKTYREAAESDENRERIRLWKLHNSLQPERPMILLFPEGGWKEIYAADPFMEFVLPPGHPLRACERHLRQALYEWRHFQSDKPLDPEVPVAKNIGNTGWGVAASWIHAPNETGARKFNPVIHDCADLKKLTLPEVMYDEAGTMSKWILAQELWGDVVPLKLRGLAHFSCHFMNVWTALRGLEETMMDMVAEPEFLHDAMAFLEQGYRGILRQYEEMRLLDLNNDNTYHSSGGVGWTDELPADGFDPDHVRPRDMWGSAESQELTLVSPQMHGDFALEYEKRVLEPFGLTGYACCDDLTLKMDRVLAIPHIRRISIAPAANVVKCAEQLGDRVIFSWKPNPTHLVGDFSEDRIAHYIRNGLEVCGRHRCVLEMILKDTHTCENHPERFDRWSEIARREVERSVG